MKGRPAPLPRSGSTGIILLLLSCLACFYVGGRLWRDAVVRHDLLELARKRARESGAVSVDDSIKLQDFREREKRLDLLEMELSAARSKGYASDLEYSALTNGTKFHEKVLAVIGINTGFGQRSRRDSIRNTWMPTGSALERLEREKKIVVRFMVGRSANRGDMSDRAIDDENTTTNDFMILENHIEGYDELPKKTKIFFSTAVAKWDADFYIKVDDDVYLNLDKLKEVLEAHKDKPRVYLGCMKSGEIYTEPNQRWHEPEWWKFGDAKHYFRHATGQVYGLSWALAHYISINRLLLHEYRNEDVSLGSWMIGLDVEHADERRLCCASDTGECGRRKATGDHCIAVFDWQCSGLCNSAHRMKAVHAECA